MGIEAALSDIEQAATRSKPKSCGPFSVFTLESTGGGDGQLQLSCEQAEPLTERIASHDLGPCLSDSPSHDAQGIDEVGLAMSDDATSLCLHYRLVDDAGVQKYLENTTANSHCSQQTDSSTIASTLRGQEQEQEHEQDQDRDQDRDQDETAEIEGNPSMTALSQQTPPQRQLSAFIPLSEGDSSDHVFLTEEVKHLLRNYATNVLPIFSPLDTSNSPWRDFHLPHALQCSIELEILADSPPARRALLHTILTISAYNLRNIHSSEKETSRKWSHVASHYKCEALKLLETCIGGSAPELTSPIYNELLAAMLCMVTIDVIAGDTSTSEIHLQASETLLRGQLAKCGDELSNITKGLHVIFLYLRTMQEATKLLCHQPEQSPGSIASSSVSSCHRQPLEDVAELMISRESDEDFRPWSLELIYGLPESLLLLLRKATRILRTNGRCDLENDVDASNSPMQSRVEQLEDEILEWPVEEVVARLETAPVSEGNRLIMQHYTRAFHQAIIIFYSREAQNVHRRHVQPYVHQVIHHLEEIEHVKQTHNLQTGHMPWPAFVAGSQAMGHDIQNRFLQWFDTISAEGIWTSSLSRDALMEVWTQTSTPVGFSALSGLHLILT